MIMCMSCYVVNTIMCCECNCMCYIELCSWEVETIVNAILHVIYG